MRSDEFKKPSHSRTPHSASFEMANIAKDAKLKGTENLLEGARKLLRHLWEVAWQNAPGTLSGDADALHDMRVAVRRMRSALQNFEGEKEDAFVSPHLRREMKNWRKELGQLGDALGAVRDYDVLNEYLDDYAKTRLRAEIEDDSGLAELRRHFLNERAAAFAKMVKRINKATRPQALREEFSRYILGLPAASGPNLPLSEVIQAIMPQRRDEVLLHVPALENPHDEIGQHELRKSLKRLRYASGIFRALFRGRDSANRQANHANAGHIRRNARPQRAIRKCSSSLWRRSNTMARRHRSVRALWHWTTAADF